MSEMARDVMVTRFHTLKPWMTIAAAVKIFQRASAESGRRVFGMLVVDDGGCLVGMLSMYDIFLLLRPKHTHIWGEMADLDLTGLLATACERAQPVLVGGYHDHRTHHHYPGYPPPPHHRYHDKKHVRRLPVLDSGRVAGIVYLSRVFDYLLAMLGG